MSMVRRLAVVMVCVGMSSLATWAAPPAGGEWPGFRGPNRDGKSPDTGLLKQWPEGGPALLWKVDGIGNGFSSVTVSGGTVYITGDRGGKLVVTALGLDGKVKWAVPVDAAWTRSHPGSRCSVTIDSGKAYVLSGNGVLGCLDAKTGKGLWSSDLTRLGGKPGGWGYAESPLIVDNMVVVKPGGKNCIVALNKATGKGIWASTGFSAGPEYSSCYLFQHDNVPMIATGTRSGIVCVAAKTGQLLWSNGFSANNTANCPTPVYSDGYVFWANGYGKGGICLKLAGTGSRATAEEAWKTKDMVCHHGGFIILDGYIYGNNGGGWSCLELKTGRQTWNERAVGKGSLCFADGMLYLFGESGGKAALASFSPEKMELRGTVTVAGSGPSWAHPVVVGGRLYLRYDDNLYCFDVKAQ
ncbi:MAG TPA: PQQ-binding-like beta-propeller repeat protein [Phycisphaerae bacterium]|nr:PQQ-binding-like beta-propeller repeat protein [Phycisphaerae bacterium]